MSTSQIYKNQLYIFNLYGRSVTGVTVHTEYVEHLQKITFSYEASQPVKNLMNKYSICPVQM